MLVQAGKREKLYGERTNSPDVFELKQIGHKIIDWFDFSNYPALSVANHIPYIVSNNRKYHFVILPGLINDKTNNRWYQRYYRSIDGGKTWSIVDLVNTTTATSDFYKIWCCSNDGKYVFYSYYTYGTYNTVNRLYISNDYGATYGQSATIPFGQILHVNCSGDGKYVYVLVRTGASTIEIRRSSDYGVNFSTVNLGADVLTLTDNSKIALSTDGSIIYTTCLLTVTSYSAVKKSTDFGVNWSNIATSSQSYISFSNVVCSANGSQYAYTSLNTSNTPNVLNIVPYGGGGYVTNTTYLLGIDNYGNVYCMTSLRPFIGGAGGSYYELVVFKNATTNTRLSSLVGSYNGGQRMTGSDEIIKYITNFYSNTQVVAGIPEIYSVNRIGTN